MICAENKFNIENEPISTSVTHACDKKKAIVLKKNLVLVDTPGIFEADTDQEKVKKEIARCKLLCAPKIDVVLFVITISRLKNEDISSIDTFYQIFGRDITNRTIIVFTHGDKLKKKSFEQFIDEIKSENILRFIDSCGKRCVCLNNKLPLEGHDRETQVQWLMEMIQNVNSNEKREKVFLDVYEQFMQDVITNKIKPIEHEFTKKKEETQTNMKYIYEELVKVDAETDTIFEKFDEVLKEMEKVDIDCHNKVKCLRNRIRDELSNPVTKLIDQFQMVRKEDHQ